MKKCTYYNNKYLIDCEEFSNKFDFIIVNCLNY
jgi:hypothetical protein